MEIKFWLNGRKVQTEIQADTLLLDLLREKECYSVKRGCETANCGLCTVLVEDKPVLSCSTLAARVEEKHVVTLEGLQEKAEELGGFLAREGAEQCGFCNPGFMMNIFAMEKELHDAARIAKTTPSGLSTKLESMLDEIKALISEGTLVLPTEIDAVDAWVAENSPAA